MDEELIIDIPIAKPGEVLQSGKVYNSENYSNALNNKLLQSLIANKKLVLVREITSEMSDKEEELASILEKRFDENYHISKNEIDDEFNIKYVNHLKLLYNNAIGFILEWTIGNIKVECKDKATYDYIKQLIADKSYIAKHESIGYICRVINDDINTPNSICMEYLLAFSLF